MGPGQLLKKRREMQARDWNCAIYTDLFIYIHIYSCGIWALTRLIEFGESFLRFPLAAGNGWFSNYRPASFSSSQRGVCVLSTQSHAHSSYAALYAACSGCVCVCVRHTKCKLTMIAWDFLVVLRFWQIARFLRLSLLKKMLLNISFGHSQWLHLRFYWSVRACVCGRAYVFVYHVCLLLFLFLSWRRYTFSSQQHQFEALPRHKLCAL